MSDGDGDTKEQIILATRRALEKHGYAGLSMAKIAAEFDGSQSTLHYHFDTKAGLIEAYLRYGRRAFEERAASLPDNPEARLDALLDELVELDHYESLGNMAAILEMYGAAERRERLRAELREYDGLARQLVRETIEDGQEAEVFADVDAEAVTWLIFAVHESAFLREIVDGDSRRLKAALEAFVLSEVRK
ncbi:TetR/AcrR family transcriptional regulator [Halosimplex sp. J119]